MNLLALGASLAVFGLAGLPAQDLPPWVLELSRVKNHARANFQRLPNYACLETIARWERPAKASAFRPLDTLHLEVALVNDKELFALAGASFDTESPLVFISRGAIGSGAFAAEARNLFVLDAARITARGGGREDGRTVLWYDFAMSEMLRSYQLQSGSAHATVGEEGRFWVDAQTLDLLRIESRAVDIPFGFPIADVTTTITYATVRIGSSDVILPETADTLIAEAVGGQQRNVIKFSGCREYGSESTIRFETPAVTPPAVPKKK